MVCHNHWTVNGAKISKSKGNYVPLRTLRQFVPGELIRAYLLTEDTLRRDGDFATEHLLRMTKDLADPLTDRYVPTQPLIDCVHILRRLIQPLHELSQFLILILHHYGIDRQHLIFSPFALSYGQAPLVSEEPVRVPDSTATLPRSLTDRWTAARQ